MPRELKAKERGFEEERLAAGLLETSEHMKQEREIIVSRFRLKTSCLEKAA